MSDWGRRTYGQPCRECGFSWTIRVIDAKRIVVNAPSQLAEVLSGATGNERHPSLPWTVTAYVAHIGDNLRIWAERLAGITRGATPLIPSYDENLLADARAYNSLNLPGVLWTLQRSTDDWHEAIGNVSADLVMAHSERGTIDLDDIVRTNAHDTAHHIWDIKRSLRTA